MLERAIVGPVAATVEESTHLHTLGGLARKEAKELLGDGVVAEVEIFEVNAFASLRNSREEVVEEFLPRFEEADSIVVCKLHPVRFLQEAHNGTVATLSAHRSNHCQAGEEQNQFSHRGKNTRKSRCEHLGFTTERI